MVRGSVSIATKPQEPFIRKRMPRRASLARPDEGVRAYTTLDGTQPLWFHSSGKMIPQDWMIFSSAGRLRMTSVAPFSCSNCFFLKSEKRRLTVSRVVPMSSPISS